MAPVTLTHPRTTHRLGAPVGGIGVSLPGTPQLSPVFLVWWLISGGEDLEAGGGFAVAFHGIVALLVGQGCC